MAKSTIKTPVPGFTGLVAGVHFVDGEGSTDDEAAISYFERQGYTVSGEVSEEVVSPYPLGDPSDKWKKAELLAYATAHGIDIGEAKTVAEIWNGIRPGGTPYKGRTTSEGVGLVNDSTDPDDDVIFDQQKLPENVR